MWHMYASYHSVISRKHTQRTRWPWLSWQPVIRASPSCRCVCYTSASRPIGMFHVTHKWVTWLFHSQRRIHLYARARVVMNTSRPIGMCNVTYRGVTSLFHSQSHITSRQVGVWCKCATLHRNVSRHVWMSHVTRAWPNVHRLYAGIWRISVIWMLHAS